MRRDLADEFSPCRFFTRRLEEMGATLDRAMQAS
jgi:hypothetical protein